MNYVDLIKGLEDRWADGNATLEQEAVNMLKTFRTALDKIASWGEGPVVLPQFDEPNAAAVARKALEPTMRAEFLREIALTGGAVTLNGKLIDQREVYLPAEPEIVSIPGMPVGMGNEPEEAETAPDCRTCLFKIGKAGWDNEDCVRALQGDHCTNGDKYEAAPQVVLWRTE